MAGLIPQSFIEDLVARVPLTDVIGSRITLKKSGSSIKACCPFHNEKTPSFNVNPKKNFYHCFGCGVSGNAITFLREYDNLSFVEAVEELAKIAGLEVPRDEKVREQYSQQKQMQDALDFASHHYQKALKAESPSAPVKQYLQKRGLSDEIVERYAIGFVPDERDFLSRQATPGTQKLLTQLKMVSHKYERPFELFQNRLMFPIRNPRGKVVAFGGRTLGDDKAKYINSPESEVFHKSREVYGLYEASQALRSIEKLLVVEGYMDVVSLAQFGIEYAVATLGTATNSESLGMLLGRCQNIVFCFDGDNAGLQAARKAMENALPLYQDGMQIAFLVLPEGEDPDTLVRQEGREAFEQRVNRAEPLSAFFFKVYQQGLDLALPEHQGILTQRAEPLLEKIPSQVLKSALKSQLKNIVYQARRQSQSRQPAFVPKDASQAHDLVGKKVLKDPGLSYCLAALYFPDRISDIRMHLDNLGLSEVASAFLDFVAQSGAEDRNELMYRMATDTTGLRSEFRNLFDRLEWLPGPDEIALELEDVLQRKQAVQKVSQAVEAVRLVRSPSDLSDKERAALQAITLNKSQS